MSYSNGYTNGSYRTNRYEDSQQEDSDSLGGSRQRRAGGYGGFYDGSPPVQAEPEAQPPPPSFRRQGTENTIGGSGLSVSRTRDNEGYDTSRSRDRAARSQNGARQHGSGPGGRQIEGPLLRYCWSSTKKARQILGARFFLCIWSRPLLLTSIPSQRERAHTHKLELMLFSNQEFSTTYTRIGML